MYFWHSSVPVWISVQKTLSVSETWRWVFRLLPPISCVLFYKHTSNCVLRLANGAGSAKLCTNLHSDPTRGGPVVGTTNVSMQVIHDSRTIDGYDNYHVILVQIFCLQLKGTKVRDCATPSPR